MDLVALPTAVEGITAEVAQTEKEAHRLEKRAKQLRRVRDALLKLADSWCSSDPGKHGDYVFFVSEYTVSPPKNGQRLPVLERCRHFHAEEVVSDLAEARLGAMPRHSYEKETRRKPVTLDTIKNAKREPCPTCAASAYIIGEYAQTYDGPDGDSWEIKLRRLCMNCCTSIAIAHCEADHRIDYLLSMPREA